jgi:hypothetical protein
MAPSGPRGAKPGSKTSSSPASGTQARAGTPITTEPETAAATNIDIDNESFNINAALRNVRSKIASMRTAGANIAIQHSVIAALDSIITKFDESDESERKEPGSIVAGNECADVHEALAGIHDIQTSIGVLEKKYENIESKLAETPRLFADVVKPSPTKNAKIETHRSKQRASLHQERAKYGVVLTTKDMDTFTRKEFMALSAKAIRERCQEAINNQYKGTPEDAPRILGVAKLSNGIRIHFGDEIWADEVRELHIYTPDIWNTVFKDLKLHKPIYGIVVHGVAVADLSVEKMSDPDTIRHLEEKNYIQAGTITKITPLRSRKKRELNDTKLHHSIIVYMNNKPATHRCVESIGFTIEHEHHNAELFVPKFQIMQCFNCYGYGHRAANCKRKSRCGKCGENHNTRDCKNNNRHCCQCKGKHEAWHPQCPARIAEKSRMNESWENIPYPFS